MNEGKNLDYETTQGLKVLVAALSMKEVGLDEFANALGADEVQGSAFYLNHAGTPNGGKTVRAGLMVDEDGCVRLLSVADGPEKTSCVDAFLDICAVIEY